MAEDNTHQFLPAASIQRDLQTAGLTSDKEIVVYCGTSREGSLLRFYLRHVARYPRVRLYEGSWKEYVSFPEHPVETRANVLKPAP
jgi:thiosulfate/3-mercaptopyruvate sulfurtransferase